MDNKFLIVLTLTPFFLFSKPTGPEVVQGKATFSHPTKSHMHINVGDQTIINWDSFSIDSRETAKFIQPNENSAVLNRVTSSDPSHILGNLEANGKIFLINSNGIFIGEGARIDTNSFIASTLDILDSEFMHGKDIRFRGNSENSIINLGTIRGLGGDVALIGRYVESHGKIEAPKGTAALAVGKEILLKPEGTERILICALSQNPTQKGTGIIQKGTIEALKIRLLADGNPYKLAIKHEGKLDALNTVEKNGEIFLVAEKGTVEVNGKISAPSGKIHVLGQKVALQENGHLDTSSNSGGGEILFGGSYKGKDPSFINSDYTYVHADAKIDVSALEKGNGGKAIVWSDGLTSFHGIVYARGGEIEGNGGFVEISGKKKLDMSGKTERFAPNGTPGTLLTDPSNILITNRDSTKHSSYIHGTYYPTDGTSILSTKTLLAQLNSGPVIVTTSSTFDGDGDIIIDTNLDTLSSGGGYGTANKLTFKADRNIHIKGSVQNSGAGNIVCIAKRDLQIDSTDRTARLGSQLGNVEVHVGRNLLLHGGAGGQSQIGFDNGLIESHISLDVGGDIILQSIDHFTLIGHTNTAPTSSAMNFNGNITIDKIGGDLILLAGNGDHQFAQIGHAPHQVDTLSYTNTVTATGNIHIPKVGGEIKLAAGKEKNDAYALIGHGGRQRSHNDSYSGKIMVHTENDLTIHAGQDPLPNKFAGIGFAQDFDGSAIHSFQSDQISVKTGGDIHLYAGQGSNSAFIGAYTGITPGQMDCKLKNIEVSSRKGIYLTGDSHPSAMSDSVIGLAGNNGPAVASISVNAGGGIHILGGNPECGKSDAMIINHIRTKGNYGSISIHTGELNLQGGTSGGMAYVHSQGPLNILSKNITINAQNNAFISANDTSIITATDTLTLRGLEKDKPASITIAGPLDLNVGKALTFVDYSHIENSDGPLKITADCDCNMGSQGSISNLTGNPVTLLVSYQAEENIGKLSMAKGATIDNGGKVALYATRQKEHEIYGLINGEKFQPHMLTTDEEIIVIVSSFPFNPIAFPRVPRSVFFQNGSGSYKNIERSQLLVSNLLTDFHSMSEYLGWFERFQVAYNEKAYAKHAHHGTSSFQVIEDQLYFLRMMNISFNNPKSANFITFPKEL